MPALTAELATTAAAPATPLGQVREPTGHRARTRAKGLSRYVQRGASRLIQLD